MKPFFSVVIPTLNEEKHLPVLIRSFTDQTLQDFEIIVVDGKSEDKTIETTKEFANKLNIRIYTSSKRNVSYQRNLGALKAKGEYIFFIDADNNIDINFLELAKSNILNNKCLVVVPYNTPYRFEGNGDLSEFEVLYNLVNALVFSSQFTNKPFSSGGNMIIDRHLFYRIGMFDESIYIAEDHELIQRAYAWGVRPRVVPELKVKFSMRRVDREGKLKFFYKYSLAIMHILFRGDIREKIFDYEMGGQENGNKNIKDSDKIKRYFEEFKKNLNSWLTED